MSTKLPFIKINDSDYPEDHMRAVAHANHVSIHGHESYELNNDIKTVVHVSPEDARKLATFLNDYCDQQGV